jgi:hypothetical protein
VVLASTAAWAHRVALKDGSIIVFDKYRVTEQSLLYIDGAGDEIKVPLSEIDYDRTRTQNQTDTAPLNLPGLALSTPPASGNTEPSLAAVAHQAHQGQTKTATGHVFTDDDFPSTRYRESAAPPVEAQESATTTL